MNRSSCRAQEIPRTYIVCFVCVKIRVAGEGSVGSPTINRKNQACRSSKDCVCLFVIVFHAAAADKPLRQPWGPSAGLQQGSALASVVSVYRNHRWQRVPKLLLVEVRVESRASWLEHGR